MYASSSRDRIAAAVELELSVKSTFTHMRSIEIYTQNTHKTRPHARQVNYPRLPRVRRGLLLRWIFMFFALGSVELLL